MEDLRSSKEVFASDNNSNNNNATAISHQIEIKGRRFYFQTSAENSPGHSLKDSNLVRQASSTTISETNSHDVFLTRISEQDYIANIGIYNLDRKTFDKHKKHFKSKLNSLIQAALTGDQFKLSLLASLFVFYQSDSEVLDYIKKQFSNKNFSNDDLIRLIVLCETNSLKYGETKRISLLFEEVLSIFMLRDAAAQIMVEMLTRKDCLEITQTFYNDFIDQITKLKNDEKDEFFKEEKKWSFKKETVVGFLLAALNYQDIAAAGTGDGRPLMIPDSIVLTVQMVLKASIDTALKEKNITFIPYTAKVILENGEIINRNYQIPTLAISIFYSTLHKLHLSTAIKKNNTKILAIVEKHFDKKDIPLLGNLPLIGASEKTFSESLQPFMFSNEFLFQETINLAFNYDFITVLLPDFSQCGSEAQQVSSVVLRDLVSFIKLKLCECVTLSSSNMLKDLDVEQITYNTSANEAIIDKFIDDLIAAIPDVELDLQKHVSVATSDKERKNLKNIGNSLRLAKKILPAVRKLTSENFSCISQIGQMINDYHKDLIGEKEKDLFNENNQNLEIIKNRLLSERPINNKDIKKIIKSIVTRRFKKILEIDDREYGAALYNVLSYLNLDEVGLTWSQKIITFLVGKIISLQKDQSVAKGLRENLDKNSTSPAYVGKLIMSFSRQDVGSLYFSLNGFLVEIFQTMPGNISKNLQKNYLHVNCELYSNIIANFCSSAFFRYQEKAMNNAVSFLKKNAGESVASAVSNIYVINRKKCMCFLNLAFKLFENVRRILVDSGSASGEMFFQFLSKIEEFYNKSKKTDFHNFLASNAINNGVITFIKFCHFTPQLAREDFMFFVKLVFKVQIASLVYPTESAIVGNPAPYNLLLSKAEYSLQDVELAMQSLGCRLLVDSKSKEDNLSNLKSYKTFLENTVFLITQLGNGISIRSPLVVYLEEYCLANKQGNSLNVKVENTDDNQNVIVKRNVALRKLREEFLSVTLNKKSEKNEMVMSPLTELYLGVTFSMKIRDSRLLVKAIVKYITSAMTASVGKTNQTPQMDVHSVIAIQDYDPIVKSEEFFAALRSENLERLEAVLRRSGPYDLMLISARVQPKEGSLEQHDLIGCIYAEYDAQVTQIENRRKTFEEKLSVDTNRLLDLSNSRKETVSKYIEILRRQLSNVNLIDDTNVRNKLFGMLMDDLRTQLESLGPFPFLGNNSPNKKLTEMEIQQKERAQEEWKQKEREIFEKYIQSECLFILKILGMKDSLLVDAPVTIDSDLHHFDIESTEYLARIKYLSYVLSILTALEKEVASYVEKKVELKVQQNIAVITEVSENDIEKDIKLLEASFIKSIDAISVSTLADHAGFFPSSSKISIPQLVHLLFNREKIEFFKNLIQIFHDIYYQKNSITTTFDNIANISKYKEDHAARSISKLAFAKEAGQKILSHCKENNLVSVIFEAYFHPQNLSDERLGTSVDDVLKDIRTQASPTTSGSSSGGNNQTFSGSKSSGEVSSSYYVKKELKKKGKESKSSTSIEDNNSSSSSVSSNAGAPQNPGIVTVDEKLKKYIFDTDKNSMVMAFKYCKDVDMETKLYLQFTCFLQSDIAENYTMVAIRKIKELKNIIKKFKNEDTIIQSDLLVKSERLLDKLRLFVEENKSKYAINRATSEVFDELGLSSPMQKVGKEFVKVPTPDISETDVSGSPSSTGYAPSVGSQSASTEFFSNLNPPSTLPKAPVKTEDAVSNIFEI